MPEEIELTVREDILANIQSSLQGITTISGYANTIKSVQRWDDGGKSTVEIPFITISEGAEEKDPAPHPLYTCRLPVYLEVETRKGSDTRKMSVILNSLLGDVEKAIMADRTRGGNAQNTVLKNNSQYTAVDGMPSAGIIIEIEVVYQHRQDDPTKKR